MNDITPRKRPLNPQAPGATPVVPNKPQPVSPQPSYNLPPVDVSGGEMETTPPQKTSKKSKKKIVLWILTGIVLLLITIAVSAFIWYKTALQPVSGDTAKTRVEVVSGSSPNQIGELLEEKKLIRSALAFDIYTRVSGTRSQLRAGVYNFSPSESTETIVNHFVSGKVDQFSITFLPGATLKENRAALMKVGYSETEVDAALEKQYEHPLLAGKPASASLEGYIYGETYNFETTATVQQILARTFDEFYTVIKENNLVAGFEKQGLNLFEGITLASIIQREEPNPTAQKQVAQVFYLRLSSDMPLGSDVTAYYGADQIGVARSVAVDTPYNTRIHKGLPPGPIATPGVTALQATAAPAEGDYVYFLSGDDDITYFARTSAEHEENIQNHCHVKCAIP